MFRLPLALTTTAIALVAWTACAADELPERVDYGRDVKPLLARRCTTCHGALRQESDLRLDAAALIRQGGVLGPAVVPGKPDESLLIQALTGDGYVSRMPKEGEPLSDEQIALLRRWVAQGASAPKDEEIPADPRQHWAFQPPQRPAVPTVPGAAVRNPIDAFLAAEHARRGLTPLGEAPQAVLLRRVSLDLIGLPPTPEQLHTFIADDSPQAYERVVDQLLDSPHYGERWGRHWMDVWRYSDWYGYRAELRNSARHIWHWRDWIVESLNADKPYDRMIVEMLAADELAPTDPQALRATGYLARSYFKFNRDTWLEDTVEHTGKAFLGLTVNCARCHDHMYDPISQQEYYRFRAFFEPYQVRTDRLPGQPDVDKDGLPRVYDKDLTKPTYLYARGDTKQPDKDHPLTAAVPAVLTPTPLEFAPIDLPPEAYYPGLKPYIQQETLAAAESAVATRRTALAQAQRESAAAEQKLAELQQSAASTVAETEVASKAPAVESIKAAQQTGQEAQAALSLAEKQLAAAEAERESVVARIAADEAKYADPPIDTAEDLAMQATRAERTATLRSVEAGVAEAELNLRRAEKPGDKKTAKAVKAAQTQLDQARKKLEAAQNAAEQPTGTYSPLTPVYPATSSGRRLALARWIADEKNPLTARVAVNHLWMRHFGEPLVESVFDFGLNGQPPTHPALLDWLAVEFMEGGWRMKPLHRLIVTSAAYRRSSSNAEFGMRSAESDSSIPYSALRTPHSVDPDNRYLWRMNARRMESEIIRDGILHLAGSLDPTLGGPELGEDKGQTTFRRSLYYRHAPEKFMLLMRTFDTANPDECYRRAETIVPQQALALANSRLAIEQARKLAAQLTAQTGGDSGTDATFIGTAFEHILCRPPSDTELATCRQFLDAQTQRLSSPNQLTATTGGPQVSIAASPDPHQRARENLVHVLFNHNEFVTIR